MSDISEPQDLEKAHVPAWFTLSKHFELHEAGYVLPRNYSFTRLSFQNILKFLLFLLSVLEDIVSVELYNIGL